MILGDRLLSTRGPKPEGDDLAEIECGFDERTRGERDMSEALDR